jgi:thiamine pyrophosphokinase
MEKYKRCVIITAFMQPGMKVRDAVDIADDDLVLCADGGLRFASIEGIRPDAVIGDFDSFEGEALAADEAVVLPALEGTGDFSPEVAEETMIPASSRGTAGERAAFDDSVSVSACDEAPKIIRLDREKDDTDTMACVKYGIARGISEFIIVGGIGGRFDHSIAIVHTLSFLIDMGCSAWARDGADAVTMISSNSRGHGTISLKPVQDSYFSIFSHTERSMGVTIKNAKYELKDALLTHSYPIGVSNEFAPDGDAEISVERGRLLIVVSQKR